MYDIPTQLRDRSISINHNRVVITWMPRDQLVPASTRYTDTTPGPPPSLIPPRDTLQSSKKKKLLKKFLKTKAKQNQDQKQKPEATVNHTPLQEPRPMDNLTSMQRLKAFWSSTPKPTIAVITSGPSLRRKGSLWDIWRRSHSQQPVKRRSCSIRDDSQSAKLACEIFRHDNGFCEGCARAIVGIEGSGSGRQVEEGASALDGPSVLRGIEVLRAEGGIEASCMSGSNYCTDAVIGDEEYHDDIGTDRNRFHSERSLKTRRECPKLRLTIPCDDGESGNVTNEGDGIRISSEDSLVLVDLDLEPVVYCAAQIGSPTGLAHGFWLSPSRRAREAVEAEARTLESGSIERPKLYRRSSAMLSALDDAIRTPLSLQKVGEGITVPPGSFEDQTLQSTAASRSNAVSKKRLELRDQNSELDTPPVRTATWHESPPSPHRMELLEHPSSPSSSGESLSGPPPLRVEQSCADSSYSIPHSLADSEFCSELIRVLSTVPGRSEWPSDSRATTSSPISPDLSNLPCEVSREHTHYSLELEQTESSAPTASPLLFDSAYFSQEQHLHPHPHPHLSREPSQAFTPYPSLNSSASNLIEINFRPTLENVDLNAPSHPPPSSSCTGSYSSLEDESDDLSATIHPPECTPQQIPHSPSLKQWSNEDVSLLHMRLPESAIFANYFARRDAGGRAEVEVRGGGIKFGEWFAWFLRRMMRNVRVGMLRLKERVDERLLVSALPLRQI